MLNVTRMENVYVKSLVEKMLDAMIGESVYARKREENFHGAVEKIAREREAIVTRKQGDVDVTVGADNRVGNVLGKYIQDVQDPVEGIAELMENAIEESAAVSANGAEYFLTVTENVFPIVTLMQSVTKNKAAVSANGEVYFPTAMANGVYGRHGAVLGKGPVLQKLGEAEIVTILRQLGEGSVLELR